MKLFTLVIGAVLIIKFAATQTGVKWNKRSKNFEPIPGLITYEEERRKVILQSRQHETHNFNGQPLRMSYYEYGDLFKYYDNDTKVTGIFGDIWTHLSDLLNFTLVLNKLSVISSSESFENGTYSGLLEDARLNKTDVVPCVAAFPTRFGAVEFSPVLMVVRQRIYTVGQWKRKRAWMFGIISMDAWAFIFAFIAILSLASVLTQRILIRHRGRKIEPESWFNHFFYSFATMCNQLSSETGGGWKFLNLTIGLFSFLTLSVYNSLLIHSMTDQTLETPFNDLKTLVENTNLRFVVVKNSISNMTISRNSGYPLFDRIKRSQRITVATSVNDLYEKICKHPSKYVLLEDERQVAAWGAKPCDLIPVGPPYYQTPIVSGISRGVKHRKRLFLGLMKMRESGVLDVIIKRYEPSNSREPVIRQANSITVDMDLVYVIFGVLCVGIVMSIIICIAENIFFTVKKRQAMQSLAKKLSAIRK